MSKIHTDHVFTSESVSEGHPDKVCDQISDAILDACLMQDPDSRVACETLTTTNLVVISGEITTKAKINWQEIALDAVRKIGYNDPNVGFCADEAKVMVCVHKQSPDISQGVTEGQGMFTEQGAGDQGMMFGYASNETPALMPAPIYYAHKIVEELARLRHTEPEKYRYLRPDSKSQVSIRYSQGKPVAVTAVVVSHQHTPDMEHSWLEALVKEVGRKVVPAELLHDDIVYYAARTAIPASPAARSSSTPTAASAATAAARSPARTPRRSTGRPPTCAVTSRRTSSRRGWPTSARFRSPTRSAWPNRCRSTSTPTAPASSRATRISRRSSARCSA